MPRGQKSQGCKLEQGGQPPREAWGLVGEQVPMEEEEEAPANASFSSAMIQATPRDVPTGGIPDCSQSPQRASSPPIAMASIPLSQSDEASTSRKVQGPLPQEDMEDPGDLLERGLSESVEILVEFLLLKYEMKEPTSQAEILDRVINYADHFPEIFSIACDYLHLVYGIDMKEVDPPGHSYVLVTALGLTYDGMLSDVQGVPKTGLLLTILGIIFAKGNRCSEEAFWASLNRMGVCFLGDLTTFGDPKKLVTDDFVREQYLEYRRVPNTRPARYELLWGPRAHAETTKMKVLEYWAKFHGGDPWSYPFLYEEALKEEIKRARARDVVRATRGRDRRRSRARKHSKATSRSSSGAM